MYGNGEGAPLNVLIVVIFKTEYSRCMNGVLSLHFPHLCVSYNIGFPIIFNTFQIYITFLFLSITEISSHCVTRNCPKIITNLQ